MRYLAFICVITFVGAVGVASEPYQTVIDTVRKLSERFAEMTGQLTDAKSNWPTNRGPPTVDEIDALSRSSTELEFTMDDFYSKVNNKMLMACATANKEAQDATDALRSAVRTEQRAETKLAWRAADDVYSPFVTIAWVFTGLGALFVIIFYCHRKCGVSSDRGILIAVDGDRGTDTSAVAAKLLRRMKAVYGDDSTVLFSFHDSSTGLGALICNEKEAGNVDVLVQWAYLQRMSSRMKLELLKGKHVVVDRYLLSWIRENEDRWWQWKSSRNVYITSPDVSFYLSNDRCYLNHWWSCCGRDLSAAACTVTASTGADAPIRKWVRICDAAVSTYVRAGINHYSRD